MFLCCVFCNSSVYLFLFVLFSLFFLFLFIYWLQRPNEKNVKIRLFLLLPGRYTCHCAEGCAGNSVEGHRCASCKEGFYGPYCQKREIYLSWDFISTDNNSCEVWGFHPAHDIEKVFCKIILSVKRSATNLIVSELGRTPLCIDRKIRILKYWLKHLKTKCFILKSLYEDMLQCQNGCNWLCQVKSILLSLGFGDVWYSQHVNHIEWFLKSVKMRLTDNFIQEWDTILDNSSKCNIYISIQ